MQTIGRFLLSLLPASRAAVVTNSAPPTVAATPDILLEAIDSFIDLYADEERDYDVPVFRQGGMLDELDKSVQGVRAAVRLSLSIEDKPVWAGTLTDSCARAADQEDRQVQVPRASCPRGRQPQQPRRVRAVPQGHPQGEEMRSFLLIDSSAVGSPGCNAARWRISTSRVSRRVEFISFCAKGVRSIRGERDGRAPSWHR
jgi:hypothetical protein